jgi:hypothetical protein
MGLADDLLGLADRLAKPTSSDPEQASLRRAVSTAYYALFHLLVAEVAQLWHGLSSIALSWKEAAIVALFAISVPGAGSRRADHAHETSVVSSK